MPITSDFRTLPFHINKVAESGRHIGKTSYWKLWPIENLVRVVVHSVLSVQINPNWWGIAVDPNTDNKVLRVMKDYASQPWHSSPGKHKIYYLFLPDLVKVISINSNLFRPLISNIDSWIARLEQIRLSRNMVGHMNWLDLPDETEIDNTYRDLKVMVKDLSRAGITLIIP